MCAGCGRERERASGDLCFACYRARERSTEPQDRQARYVGEQAKARKKVCRAFFSLMESVGTLREFGLASQLILDADEGDLAALATITAKWLERVPTVLEQSEPVDSQRELFFGPESHSTKGPCGDHHEHKPFAGKLTVVEPKRPQ